MPIRKPCDESAGHKAPSREKAKAAVTPPPSSKDRQTPTWWALILTGDHPVVHGF